MPSPWPRRPATVRRSTPAARSSVAGVVAQGVEAGAAQPEPDRHLPVPLGDRLRLPGFRVIRRLREDAFQRPPDLARVPCITPELIRWALSMRTCASDPGGVVQPNLDGGVAKQFVLDVIQMRGGSARPSLIQAEARKVGLTEQLRERVAGRAARGPVGARKPGYGYLRRHQRAANPGVRRRRRTGVDRPRAGPHPAADRQLRRAGRCGELNRPWRGEALRYKGRQASPSGDEPRAC
jgi:hypothetical protein